MKRFIHFGCWNNLNEGKTCLTNTMTKLKKYIKTHKDNIDFISVAGDNYYPDKIKNNKTGEKIKKVDTQNLLSGFQLLPNNKPIYMILGNHDLETNQGQNNIMINNYNEPENNCAIINNQITSLLSKSNVHYDLFHYLSLSNDTLMLMIDTSLYSEDAPNFVTCYNSFISHKNNIEANFSLDELREKQLDFILESIKKQQNIKNLIIVGHHPITGLKHKKEKVKLMDDIPDIYSVLNNIYNLLESHQQPNYYYLCADLHMYQHGQIRITFEDNKVMNIHQYIVGTGGTELDDNSQLKQVSKTNDNISYTMLESVKKCGFLNCYYKKNRWMFNFVDNNKTKYRKTKKRKKMKNTKKTRKTKKTK